MSGTDLLEATREWQKVLPQRETLMKRVLNAFQREKGKNLQDKFPMLDEKDYKEIDDIVDELFENGARLLKYARNHRTPSVAKIKEKLKEWINSRRRLYQNTGLKYTKVNPNQTMNILRQFGYNDEQIEKFMRTHFIGSNARNGELEMMLEKVRENTIDWSPRTNR